MIHLKFEQAVAFYILFFIIIFICGWIFFEGKKTAFSKNKDGKLWQCSICAFVYLRMFDENMTICPQCGSYNKKEGQV